MSPTTHTARARGFSLIELAIALTIMGVLLTGVLVPMVTQVAQRKLGETEKTLENVKDALLGFAAANGRLPCPALEAATGVEAFAGGGNVSNGNCATFTGFVPAITLGITPVDNQGYLVDGWATGDKNRVRYAVSNQTVNTITNPFTRTDGIRNATMGQIAAAALLYVCSSGVGVTAASCGAAGTLTSNAVVVVWSAGPNASSGGTSPDEAQNPSPKGFVADRVFVSHPVSDSTANPFDDVVTWVGTSTLTNRLIAAGQLP